MSLAQKSGRPPRRRPSGEMMKVVVPNARESGVRLAAANANDAASPDLDSHDIDELRAIASALMTAAAGFDVCARRARTNDVATRMAALAAQTKRTADDASALVPGGVRRLSTSERLRWEWLASTAALLDGGAESRLCDEANRHVAAAVVAASRVEDDSLGDVVSRVHELAAMGRVVTESGLANGLASRETA